MTDVSKAFEMPNLGRTICNKVSAYRRGFDYKVFITPKRTIINYDTTNEPSNETSNEKTTNKRTFLTLSGLIRVLHVSRNKNAFHYCAWVKQIVYTHQFGTQDQKEELTANLLGVSAKIIKSVYNTISDQIPCVYLFTLGYVKDLRESMRLGDVYDDDDVVAKYGFSKDLTRRTGEHIKKYGKIANSILRLKYNTFVDPLYLSNAETDIKSFVDSLRMKLDYENEDELIVIPQRLEKRVKEQYALIGAKYVGHNSILITKIKQLESDLERETSSFENKIMLKNAELKQKDSEIDIIKRDTTIELLKRDSTILLLKYENKDLKNEMNMMVMEQQLLEQKRINELLTNQI
jgi:phosphopantetheine adenylyltransferase